MLFRNFCWSPPRTAAAACSPTSRTSSGSRPLAGCRQGSLASRISLDGWCNLPIRPPITSTETRRFPANPRIDSGGYGNASRVAAVSPTAGSTIRLPQRKSLMNAHSLSAILMLVVANAVFAADSSGPAARADPMMDRYNAAAERQDWKSAAAAMSEALGANPYIAEAYLLVGNVAKAQEHLSALDKICFFGCSEYDDLKKAISEAETKSVKQ